MPQQIEAVLRDTGNRVSRRLRKQALVPAVIYGKALDPLHIAVDRAVVARIIAPGAAHLHRIVVKDSDFEGNVVVKEVQRHPISRQVLHIDFHHVSMGERIRVQVPVVLLGEDRVEKRGLVVQRQLREVEVECLPDSIPDTLSADVSSLAPGQALLVKDLVPPSNVAILTSPTEVVAVVVVPKAAQEVTEAPAGPAAAPAAAETATRTEEKL